jgi:ankyrin repeat protein
VPERSVIELVDAGEIEALQAALVADPGLANSCDPDGLSALMHAIYHRRRDVIDAVLECHENGLDLFESAALGEIDRVNDLIAHDRTLITQFSADGFQALHLGAYFGHPRVVRGLITSGADLNSVARNPSQVRPLHSAVSGRHGGVVEMLLEAGADPDPPQAHGWTALHSAAHQGNTRLVEMLLEHGANPTARADDGTTPADMARQGRHDELADRLDAYTPADA